MSMSFADLDAWKKARELVNTIYRISRETVLAKDFGLCSQMQRAAVSVMSNVAEGFERLHAAEKLQAYNIARASCGEVRSLLYVVEDNYPIHARTVGEARALVVEVGRLTSGLISSTRKRIGVKIGTSAALLSIAAVLFFQLLKSLSENV
ncbi:MAG: four helix bundle protein [Bacteroidota bacterium]